LARPVGELGVLECCYFASRISPGARAPGALDSSARRKGRVWCAKILGISGDRETRLDRQQLLRRRRDPMIRGNVACQIQASSVSASFQSLVIADAITDHDGKIACSEHCPCRPEVPVLAHRKPSRNGISARFHGRAASLPAFAVTRWRQARRLPAPSSRRSSPYGAT